MWLRQLTVMLTGVGMTKDMKRMCVTGFCVVAFLSNKLLLQTRTLTTEHQQSLQRPGHTHETPNTNNFAAPKDFFFFN